MTARHQVTGYRCVACGEWSPAEHWHSERDAHSCPTCLAVYRDLPKVETRRLHSDLRPLGAPVRRLLDGMAPDGEPQPTTGRELSE